MFDSQQMHCWCCLWRIETMAAQQKGLIQTRQSLFNPLVCCLSKCCTNNTTLCEQGSSCRIRSLDYILRHTIKCGVRRCALAPKTSFFSRSHRSNKCQYFRASRTPHFSVCRRKYLGTSLRNHQWNLGLDVSTMHCNYRGRWTLQRLDEHCSALTKARLRWLGRIGAELDLITPHRNV